jgi:predicted metal-binding transcription factor (methanogenesis marker protein 9)
LEKENLDLRDACIKLKKALDDKQDQLSNSNMLNGEVMDLKEKLRDYELNRSR